MRQHPTRLAVVDIVIALLLLPSLGAADDMPVPIELQAKLLAKVVGYERTIPVRAGSIIRVGILSRAKHANSSRASSEMRYALSTLPDIAGLRHEEFIIEFQASEQVADLCKTRDIHVIYVTPGFEHHTVSLGKALVGSDVLTVSGVATYVGKGVSLGFDLVSSKPKMLIHLPTASAHGLSFRAEILKLMKAVP